MADGQGFGSALLSVNGAPVRAFRSGEVLVPGVVLDSVWADYVVIDQDGRREQLDMVRAPANRVNGFIAAP
jgi:hypothetical protein